MQTNSIAINRQTDAQSLQRFLGDQKSSGGTLRGHKNDDGSFTLSVARSSVLKSALMSLGLNKQGMADGTAARAALQSVFPGASFTTRSGPLQVAAALRVIDSEIALPKESASAHAQPEVRQEATAWDVDGFVFPTEQDDKLDAGRESSVSRSSVSSQRTSVDGSLSMERSASDSAVSASGGSFGASAEKSRLSQEDLATGILDARDFPSDASKGEDVGGKTGSRKHTFEGFGFQVKTRCGAARGLAKGGRHAENLRELIGARVLGAINNAIARKIDGAPQPGADGKASAPRPLSSEAALQDSLVPKVSIIHDPHTHNVRIGSKYVSTEPTPTLDAHAVLKGAQKNASSHHVRAALSPPSTRAADAALPKDVFVLGGKAKEDAFRSVAYGVLALDHDRNGGNGVVVNGATESPRFAAIDFGHAFGDMIFASAAFGGGVADPDGNLARDYFNREKVAGSKPGGSQSKIWRDFVGLVPAKGLADALREVAQTKAATQGLNEARSQLQVVVRDLAVKQGDDPREAAAKRTEAAEVGKSLASISTRLGMPVDAKSLTLEQVVDKVFANLGNFIEKHQGDMLHVGNLCELQARIDDSVALRSNGQTLDKSVDREINADIDRLHQKVKQGGHGDRITWLKVVAGEKAFRGDLSEYVAHRMGRGKPDF